MISGSDIISRNEIYNKLGQNYSKLASLDKQDAVEKFNKDDASRISSNENYDEKDYERVLDKFEATDARTHTHEQTHASSVHASTPDYTYQQGPDGKLYALGGSVRMDTSVPKDEAAAAAKMENLSQASTAPHDLSAADAQISRTASLNKMLLLSIQGEENAS
jgi:hypothetical protein